jgi:hypothetical protein
MMTRASRMLPTASLRPMRHGGRMGGTLPVRPMRAPLPHPRAAAAALDVRTTRLAGTALGGAAPAAYRLQTRRGFRYPPLPSVYPTARHVVPIAISRRGSAGRSSFRRAWVCPSVFEGFLAKT